jgi:hypothetical protein
LRVRSKWAHNAGPAALITPSFEIKSGIQNKTNYHQFPPVSESYMSKFVQDFLARPLSLLFCLLLCGCILQSPKPIFDEKDGKPVLKQFGNSFLAFNRESGEWKKQDDIVKFTTVGNHYVVQDKSGDINVLFAQLSDQWFVMQTNETGKASTYLLAKFEGKSLVLNILSCKVLKTNKSLKDAISFKGDECTANQRMTKERFIKLTKSPEAAMLKIEAEK